MNFPQKIWKSRCLQCTSDVILLIMIFESFGLQIMRFSILELRCVWICPCISLLFKSKPSSSGQQNKGMSWKNCEFWESIVAILKRISLLYLLLDIRFFTKKVCLLSLPDNDRSKNSPTNVKLQIDVSACLCLCLCVRQCADSIQYKTLFITRSPSFRSYSATWLVATSDLLWCVSDLLANSFFSSIVA